MIKYKLECECGEIFDSWFSNSIEYEQLNKKKMISCVCGKSNSVKKSIMGPNLSSKSNKVSEKNHLQKDLKKQLLKLRKYVEKNCKYVGENFSQEARSIHYDKKSLKGIYGKATPEETAELLEEGIDVTTVPWVDKSEN
tara:strand:- start:677 stop:1093 length:417 start_codon:yes stop_codon:yes gene_type:complete